MLQTLAVLALIVQAVIALEALITGVTALLSACRDAALALARVQPLGRANRSQRLP